MSQDLSSQNENAAPKGLQRRQVLRAAAWAAPALVLTTAAPAYAASYPAPGGNSVLVLNNFTIDGLGNITGTDNTGKSSHKKRIAGNFQFQYNPTNWGAEYNVTVPASLTVTYTLTVGGTVIESGTAVVLGQYATISATNWKTSNDLATGSYPVEFSVSAPAQTIGVNTFTPAPISVSAVVQVNN